jgi:hypothetical protein
MKKTMVLCMALLLMALPALAEKKSGATSPVAAIIMLYKGDVLMQPAGAARWFKPMIGMAVNARDTLKTGKNSYVNIAFANGSLLKISQNSIVEISMLSYDVKKQIVKGEAKIPVLGKLLASFRKLKKENNSFDIYSPTAVAGIRGTELMVDVKEDMTTVAVFQGKLIVKDLVNEQGMSTDNNEMMLDFLREAVVGSDQVLEYKKGSKLPKAKAMGKEYDADKAQAKALQNESAKLAQELSKTGADKKWADAEKLRAQAIK